MAFSNAQLDADLAVIVADLPVAITVGSATISGTRMTLRRDVVLADEGLRQNYRFSVYVRFADLAAVPALRTKATIGGVSYRILRLTASDDARLYRLDLGEEYARG
jgi:hypothetical protein